MSATRTRSHNRVSPYLDSPKPQPVLPTDPAARQAILGDAVLRTIIALQGLLASDDPVVVLKAAGMILDLEKTSIGCRHHLLRALLRNVVDRLALSNVRLSKSSR